MFETIGKTILWILVLIGAPLLLIGLLVTLGVVGPILGIVALICLPAITIGIIIGRKSAKED